MNVHPLLGMVLVLLALLGMLLALDALRRRAGLGAEESRKLMHVGMGLVSLTLPWLFDERWPVIILTVTAAASLTAIRTYPPLHERLGGVIGGVTRTSFGEIYYPISVGALFVLAFGEPLLFVVPMLLLTLADAAAAVIGLRYGSVHYKSGDGTKSVEGSMAFFVVAFLSAHVPLLLFSDLGRVETLLIAVILGLLVMLLEMMSWRGLDNLFIPLGAFAFLSVHMALPADALLLRLLATLALVGFTLAWSRRTSLDTSALIAAGLFGYLALMLGGWRWLVAPLILFIIHTLAWPRDERGRYQDARAVLCTGFAGLVLLLLYARLGYEELLYPYSIAFAAHIGIIGASRLAWRPTTRAPALYLGGCILGAWSVITVPLLAILIWLPAGPSDAAERLLPLALVALLAVAVPALLFHRLTPALYGPPVRVHAIDGAGALLGALAALIAGVLLWLW